MPKMKLVPYQIKSVNVQNQSIGIPYGVTMISDPKIERDADYGNGIVVAILDTGIDKDFPDKENIIGGRNFTDDGNHQDIQDENGHGTHVAGTILDVANKASLLICKVLDKNGSGDYHQITKGIRWATHWRGKNGERVRVINMSLGGSHNDPDLYDAILEACADGILFCVASGNEGDENPNTFEYGYPALHNECITVAACDSKMKLAGFSNEHLQVDIIAPGVDIESNFLNGQYATLSGTSMATPHIAGALTLVINVGEKAFRRVLTESEIYALLVKCCCSLGYKKSSEGNGIPDLTKLIKECSDGANL
jgi:major intracellular serine protease